MLELDNCRIDIDANNEQLEVLFQLIPFQAVVRELSWIVGHHDRLKSDLTCEPFRMHRNDLSIIADMLINMTGTGME